MLAVSTLEGKTRASCKSTCVCNIRLPHAVGVMTTPDQFTESCFLGLLILARTDVRCTLALPSAAKKELLQDWQNLASSSQPGSCDNTSLTCKHI